MLKIGFCGTHSTGKTTMVEALRTEPPLRDKFMFDINVTRWVKSLGFSINEETNDASQEINMIKRIAHLNSYDNIIADRTIIDVLAYSRAGRERGSVTTKSFEYQNNLVLANIQKYDHIFYLPMDIEVTDDGVRAIEPGFRKEIDEYIDGFLSDFNIKYTTIRGSVRQRVQQVLNIIGEQNL